MKSRKLQKTLALLLALALAMTPGLLSRPARAAQETTVYVSVADGGAFVTGRDGGAVAGVPVRVDGETPTVGDVFTALHAQYYDGDGGYAAVETEWGGRVDTFWGIPSADVEYRYDHALDVGLSDPVAEGGYLCVWFCQDAGGADAYAYFDRTAAAVMAGGTVRLTLTVSGEEGGSPLAGAAVTVDGARVKNTTTGEDGRVTLVFDQPGAYVVSAAAGDGACIVPPVCVVTVEKAETDDRPVMETLMNHIAASCEDSSDDWVLLDMAACEKLGLGTAVTSDAAKQAYVDAVIATLQGEKAGDTACAKAILALTAIGVDAARLYPAGSDAPISAVDSLNAAAQSPSALCAPYTLAAYNQRNYRDTETYQATLVDAILDTQNDDGSWSERSDSIQATANMIVGLSFYREVNAAAAAAIDRALDYLSAVQKDDGSFESYSRGADANSAAAVVIALAAVGVDPDADARFVKYGNSALDGLLSFAYADYSGFGYRSGEKGEAVSAVASATEQGFRALIAAWQVMATGEAYNIYDFSGTATVPGYESADGLPGKHADVKKTAVTAPEATFSDIDGRQDQAAIETLARREIITGKDNGAFDPDADMTRAEFAAIVVRALGLEPRVSDAFSDVKSGDWFAPYVGAACAYGIVNGGDDGAFAPLDTITRQEAAVMVARAAALCGLDTAMEDSEITGTLARFGDCAAVGEWARAGVAFCYRAGILDQSGVNAEPTEAILRCEIARMLYNLLDSAKLL